MSVLPTPVSPPEAEELHGFPRGAASFLTELAFAYSKLRSYPPTHPAVADAAERVSERLADALTDRFALTIAITRDAFSVDGDSSDQNNKLVAGLARRLHDEQLGALVISQGADLHEIRSLLAAIVNGSSIEGTPLGLGIQAEITWPHVRLVPIAYDKLQLATGSDAALAGLFGGSESVRQLWLELATAAGGTGSGALRGGDHSSGVSGDGSAAIPDPTEVAAALNGIGAGDDGRRSAAATGVLVRLVEESAASHDRSATSVQRYLSELIGTLSEETLERLMRMENDPALRKRFLMAASEGLAADAMVALARAAATTSKVTISTPLLRMMEKLATNTTAGSERHEAVKSLVRQTVSSWSGNEGVSAEYGELLQYLSVGTPDATTLRGTMAVEPLSVLALGLELGLINPAIQNAADQAMVQGDVGQVLDALDLESRSNADVASTLRAHVLRPRILQMMLRNPELQFDSVQRFATELGVNAADPLFDLLASTDDRTLRSRLLTLLAQMGADVGPLAAGRLPNSPWFVQRNLLELLARLPELPATLSLLEYTRHNDPRVRRAAYKVALKDAARRDDSLLMALEDEEEDVFRMALGVALESAPLTALPIVRRRYERGDLPDDLRALCIRLLAPRKDPGMLNRLLALSATPRRFLRKERLLPKNAEMLAAIAALAAYWGDDPRAAHVVALAQGSSDSDIRHAAQGGRRGGTQ